jgi:photosystem II stability/assembly factor-like uncharacterized protein
MKTSARTPRFLMYFLITALLITSMVQLNAQDKKGGKTKAKTESKAAPAIAKKDKTKDIKKDKPKSDSLQLQSFGGLKWRSIGPALTSGRIADFAVNPKNPSEYYVAVASGHVWKTSNRGVTFEPIFDNYGAYAIGCVTIDPGNTNVVWVGTGENNHQRVLGSGDGVYKSNDGGKSFKNMGLRESRQIGEILIDPRNSDIVFVAAEGSVWGPGGERGLYKTSDGGKTWKKVLEISENTGVNNVLIDPRNPDVMYASSEQRRRHVFTKIGGGPETAVYKSTNAGETWDKLTSGLPGGDMGGIGMAISPVDPDVVYAIIEATEGGGFYRTSDRGASWQKMSDHAAQGQYYNEIACDPKNVDKVYSTETVSQVTEDGGKTWRPVGNNKRHVDDHAIWIDPSDTRHFLIGSDGGIYESFDEGKEFRFTANLPVTQFYRVQVDNALPFYNIYGGTQDNNSLGGPSRNTSTGVVNDDWFVTNGGDGFWSQIDPEDPNTVYAEAQYGNMVRYDKRSGEAIEIRPEPKQGENSYKWNWNTPLIISPHSHTRLYVSANKVFRSDDRGNTWQVISGDLSTGLDRETWPVMGKHWSVDAVAKNVSTSLYGIVISLDESPVKENLLYAGTDDGLIQVTEDAGRNWAKVDKFPGVPANTYVSDVFASRFDENVVFASFDNILRDDFKPYLLKSNDKGRTWTSIAGNLPVKGTVHTIQQDFVNADLLFVGTEYGFFFSNDGGKVWVQLKSGMPLIPVKDIAIQKRESDLVVATFGRGFYVLDNYSPLRTATKELMKQEGSLFPVKEALMYIQTDTRYGEGSGYYKAPNPDFGAVITYSLKEVPETLKAKRHKKEADLFKAGDPIPQPTEAELKAEKEELAPYLTFTISDASGNMVRRLNVAPSAGLGRVVWDLHYQTSDPAVKTDKFDPLAEPGSSYLLAMPGKYSVNMAITAAGETKHLAGPVEFNAVVLNNTTFPTADRQAMVDFNKKAGEISGIMQGTEQYANGLFTRLQSIIQLLGGATTAAPELKKKALELSKQIDDILFALNGKVPAASEEENPPAPVPLYLRLNKIAYLSYGSTSEPTQTQKECYRILTEEFPPLYAKIKAIGEVELPAIESALNAIGAPATPGRLPEWKK